ncbi:hypothetical protein [Desulfosarcina cetonica]|uniref:hypothetical protein n=1 Tax=Desulfosarcina cetonica TaxID=90730 RepID=UPI0006CF212D|nr:hypothetical protein [Desulfosarcina cetonica]
MQQPRIFVGEDLNREPGYTIFTLEGISGVVDRISYSVVRHGYDFNYLGEKEWQAAFSWLEPEDAWYENGTLKFIVPPDVTWQLEPQGYVLRLNLTPTIGDVSFDFFWPDVLPAESTGQPSNAQRLSGTRVKPVTADTSGQPSAIKTVVPAATNEDFELKDDLLPDEVMSVFDDEASIPAMDDLPSFENLAPLTDEETPVAQDPSSTQEALIVEATPADRQEESAPAEKEDIAPSRKAAAWLDQHTPDEPSKGPKSVLILLAIIATFALLAGLCLFFLNSGSSDQKQEPLSDRPSTSEASGNMTDPGTDKASQSSAEGEHSRTEITEVSKPVVIPETKVAEEPSPNAHQQNFQTESILQNAMQQEKERETPKKTDNPSPSSPR